MQPEYVPAGLAVRLSFGESRLHSTTLTRNGLGQKAVARKVGRLTGDTMKAMKNLLAKLVKDEQGGEVLEYALIAGLIVVAAIAIIDPVGGKVLGRIACGTFSENGRS